MAFQNGRGRPDTDVRTLQFSNYVRLLDDHLETPASAGLRAVNADNPHDAEIRLPDGRAVPFRIRNPLGNDKYLTCVSAAMLRLDQAWRTIAGEEEVTEPTDDRALEIHMAIKPEVLTSSGGPAMRQEDASTTPVPTVTPFADRPVTILNGFKHWRGYAAEHNLADTKVFLEIEPGNIQQLQDAISLSGGALIGVELPYSVLDEKDVPRSNWYLPAYGPTADATPGSWGSHCVAALGFDRRSIYCVGWDRVFAMTYQFFLAYAPEVFFALPAEKMRTLPPAFQNRIDADLNAVGNPSMTLDKVRARLIPRTGRPVGGPNIMGGGPT